MGEDLVFSKRAVGAGAVLGLLCLFPVIALAAGPAPQRRSVPPDRRPGQF